ncbi:MAG: sugar phosphate nucleotidyltransferase [Clostridia bacterium]|nr:sugar phosphate nucleotidyltransferase [Clostridia bacterium]
MEKTLLVMAAGAGSRFGGLKQIAPVGENGEILLDYSVFDAINAGFNKIVFVIKPEMEKDFRNTVGRRWENKAAIEYAFQRIDDLPGGRTPHKDRVKPWGTCQAVLCARDKITTPFAVINSDDYYGKIAYARLAEHFEKSGEMCMVAYDLKNTLSDNGTVTRGVCRIENGYLTGVEEYYNLDKNSPLSPDTKVSMNLWGFRCDVFDKLEARFEAFLRNLKDPLKGEYILPSFMGELIGSEGARVKVLTTPDSWIGMTYKEDIEAVRREIAKLHYKF